MLRLTLSACPHCINGALWTKPAQPAPRPAGDEMQDMHWGGAAPHCSSHSVTSTVWNPHPAGPSFGITARQPITLGKSWWFQLGNRKGKHPVLKAPFPHFVGCFHRSLSGFWALPHVQQGASLFLSARCCICAATPVLCHTACKAEGSSGHLTDIPSPNNQWQCTQAGIMYWFCKFRLAETNPELPLCQLETTWFELKHHWCPAQVEERKGENTKGM